MKFFKLLKYEFLENIASVALINVALLALLYIMRMCLNGNLNNSHWIVGVIIALAPVAILASSVFLLNIIIKTLYARLFSQEGYLTLSLPVSIDAILISKILTSMLWVLISVFVVWLWFVSVIDDRFHIMYKFFRIIVENYTFLDILRFIVFALVFTLKPIVLVLFILSILHIGKITKFRQIIGIILFVVILLIENIFTGYLFIFVDDIFDFSFNPIYPLNQMQVDNVFLLISLYFIISILPIFVYYCCSRYLIKNKLEI